VAWLVLSSIAETSAIHGLSSRGWTGNTSMDRNAPGTVSRSLPRPPQGAPVPPARGTRLVGIVRGRLVEQARGTLDAARIDLRDLPTEARLLTLLGYAGAFAVMAAALVFEFFGDWLPSVTYAYGKFRLLAPGPTVQVAVASFVLAWSLLLTGATDFGWRLFVPILVLFAFDLVFLASAGGPGPLTSLLVGVGVLLLLTAVTVRIGQAKVPRWRDRPLVEFVGWAVALSLFVGLVLTLAPAERSRDVLLARLPIFGVIIMPLWLLFGIEPARLGVEIAARSVRALRTRLGNTRFRRLAAASAILPVLFLAGIWAAIPASRPGWAPGYEIAAVLYAPGWTWPFFLMGWTAFRLLRRRWSDETAAVGLGLTVATLVLLAAFLVAGTSGQDFVGFALLASGLFNPLVLYVVLMTYNILTVGRSFASAEGRATPRSGRVLVYFGAVILILCSALLPATQRPAAARQSGDNLQVFIDAMFAYGVVTLGPGYLVWIAWRRRARLLGEAEKATGEPEATVGAPVGRAPVMIPPPPLHQGREGAAIRTPG